MRVFVAGASGYVGFECVRALRRRGHEVVGLVHTPSKADAVRAAGAQVIVGDLSGEAWIAHARGSDALVHCAQIEAYTKRISSALLRQVKTLDEQWTRKLLEVGAGAAKTFVYSSGIFIYGDQGDASVDEETPLRPGAMGALKQHGEQVAFAEAKRLGYPSCVAMRLGHVYGLGGTFEATILKPALKGRARWIGSGNQFYSPVFKEDVGEAYALAVEKAPGFVTLNLCDDEPVRIREYLAELSRQVGAKPPGGVPTFVVSLFGGAIGEALAAGCRMSNARLKQVLGWKPSLPTHREGMAHLAEQVGRRSAA